MIDQFKQIPTTMQGVFAALFGTTVVGFAYMFGGTRGLIVALIFLLLIITCLVLWWLFKRYKERKRSKALNSQMGENASAAPSSVSDPSGRAKLDDLRQKFQKGLETFRAAGKDVYSLPWYIVCGEPGSGKSEAVRHCNVGFPPGLQNEMQGAGGTLNMHWWFTNQAVLLDTAGKLLFSEAPPGTTSEWQEFLKLLKKSRPNCPVNGLLLVIPSDSLIRDSFENVTKKARKIASELDRIQRTLDVRFPVFVLITKCDLINGFREFFSGIRDPQLQHQMMGWSNPEPLDTPFRADTVDQHLNTVAQRISRRRLGMLRDPVSPEAGARRIDEVDALFALPASISALAPRLRAYLETIFVGGEWAAKPLFLRGIYFTSAITEGGALDADLAAALGMPIENLPEKKAWERERSFFLRDLFIQKIFKEKGLVTRASNTRKQVRTRNLIFASVLFVSIVTVLVFTFLGQSALKRSIGDELGFWKAAARDENWTPDGLWRPLVTSGQGYRGQETLQTPNGEETLLSFHSTLQTRVSKELKIPWIFKPVESMTIQAGSNRQRAQRVLFEAGVIKPLLLATRERIQGAESVSTDVLAQMAALVELEGQIHLREFKGFVPGLPADAFFDPLLAPWLEKVEGAEAAQAGLLKVFEWTYNTAPEGKGHWPADWMTGGRTLRDNVSIRRGLEALEQSVTSAQKQQQQVLTLIRDGRLTTASFLDSEQSFMRAASGSRSSSDWVSNVTSTWEPLSVKAETIDSMASKGLAMTKEKSFSLEGSYRVTVDRLRQEIGGYSTVVTRSIEKQKAALEASTKAGDTPAPFKLYAEIQKRLATVETTVSKAVEKALPVSEQAQLQDLDAVAFKPLADGSPAYAARVQYYREAMAQLTAPSVGDDLLGHLGDAVGGRAKALLEIGDRASKYDGPRRAEFSSALKGLLEACETSGVKDLSAKYARQLEASVSSDLGFPLGKGSDLSLAKFKEQLKLLDRVRADSTATGIPSEARFALQAGFEKASKVTGFAQALLGADGSPLKVKLILVKDKDQNGVLERVGVLDPQRPQLARIYRSMRVAGRSLRTQSAEGMTLWEGTVSDQIPDFEFSTTPDPKMVADAKFSFGAQWAPLHLVVSGAQKRTDGREWEAVLRVKDAQGESQLAVLLVFEKPLPELSDWPAVRP